MTIKPKPTDAEIKQIMYWGSQQMTYVIRNGLSMAGHKGKTNWVRRQLERLGAPARLSACHQFYARQICWALVEVVRP